MAHRLRCEVQSDEGEGRCSVGMSLTGRWGTMDAGATREPEAKATWVLLAVKSAATVHSFRNQQKCT